MKSKNKKTTNKIAEPEAVIVKLARQGKLARAGQMAIRASHRLGLDVTILENNNIIKLHPNGTKTLVKRLLRKPKKYATGKMFIN